MTQIIANNNGWGWGWSSSGYVTWPNWAENESIAIFDWTTGKAIKDSGVNLSEKQDTLTAWTDLEIIPPAWDQTVTGNNSISLNWAIDDGLISLTAYWDTRQWHYLPEWYTELWAIQNVAGSTKWNSWYAPNQNWDTLEVRFIANTNSLYLIQARKDSTSPIYWIWGSATGNTIIWYVNWYSVTSSISRVAWHVVYIRFSFASWSMTLYVKDESTGEEDTQTGTYTWANMSYSYRIWGNNAQTYWSTMWILYVKMTLWGGAVRELIPAKNSSNVIGWYDIATSTFRSSFEWDSPTQLYISPHPLAPEELSCNNWVIKAFYWNKFTTSWRTAWKLINSSTGILEDNDNYNTTAYIFLRKWRYTATWQDTAAWNRQYKCYSYYDDWTPHALIFSQTSPWTSLNTITFTMNYDSKVRFSYRSSMSNITASPTNPIIYTDWNVETIEDEDWNTVTTEMLFWIWDNQDTQEILTGAVNKKIWIKILDGTEDWETDTTNIFYCTLENETNSNDIRIISTHYWETDEPDSTMPNYKIRATNSSDKYICSIKDTRYSTVANFTSFLQSVYNAGNPVIVVYTLPTATTSTVTGQTLTTVEWDNTIEITQSGITPLSITWVYQTPSWTVINFTNDTWYITSTDVPVYTAWTGISINDYVISATWWWGNGDVVWPNSSTNWNLAVFDWTTGKLIKDWWAVPVVPTIVDNLTTQSATSTLSANQWYVLKWLIDDLMGQGRFLSLWDCSTWLPISFPLSTPYTYLTGDYFMVETLDTVWEPPVNYRPTGSSYSGTASSTAETWEVKVWDYYVYDWTVWLLASNHWKDVTFSNIAWQPSDNANLSTALNSKQNNWIDVTVNTSYGTVAKVWTTTWGDYTPTKWDWLLVNFVNGNNATNNITLKIDNSASKDVKIWIYWWSNTYMALWNTNGSNVKILMYYDWECYRTWTTTNTNTTYSAMTVSEWQTGTATTSRTMRADRLPSIIQYHAVDDTAYASSWDWVTNKAPSKNAVYDAIEWAKPTYWQILITDLTSWTATWEIDDWALVSGWVVVITLDDTFTGAINSIDINWMDSITVYPQLTNIREWMTWIYISSSENWNELYLFPNTDTTGWGGGWSGDVTWPNSSTDWNVVLFDWATGKIIKDSWTALSSKADATDVNTKTFYLSSTSDTTTAQSALDWYLAGKNPIIVYDNRAYVLWIKDNTRIQFYARTNYSDNSSDSTIVNYYIKFTLSSWTVQSITSSTESVVGILRTGKDYSTPYTPQYNGSPATKKYVDDWDTVVSGDSWTTYTIKVSNSAPASWTPNTTITFVV